MIRTLFLIFLCSSCSYFKSDEQKTNAVARVFDKYLYYSDVELLLPQGTSKEDSLLFIKAYIDQWAKQQILKKQADINLSDDKKKQFNSLIEQYKNDLYNKAYLEEVVKQKIDTTVTENELIAYYNANRENFKTNGVIVKLRYINVSKENPRLSTIKNKFDNFSKKDKKFWDTYVLQSKSAALNDSIWVELNQIYKKLPFINPENRDKYIIPGKRIEETQGENLFLVKIKNVIDKNQVCPYEYIKPTIKELLLNQKKLKEIKKLEKELIEDAIKNKDYVKF